MKMEIIKQVEFDSPLMRYALDVRREVFVCEQGVAPEIEFDSLDADAVHLVTMIDGFAVATLRIVQFREKDRIGRVAVRRKFRGGGIGSRIVCYAVRLVFENGGQEIVLRAQLQTLNFYQRLGFHEEGEVELDARIPHMWMRYNPKS